MSKNSDKLKALSERISQSVAESVSAAESKRLGDALASQIKKRTRLGYGSENGQQKRLRGLSERYKEYREEHAEDLSQATRPGRSNLTATGQMLDSITGVGTKGRVNVEIKGQRTKELGGRRSRLSNNQVARYVQEQGRAFFNVTKAEKNSLAREVKQLILTRLRKK